jgi:FdhE protein
LFATSIQETPPTITEEAAQLKWASSVPLLRDLPVQIDEAAFRRRWLAVSAAIAEEDAELLADAVCQKKLDPLSQFSEALAGRIEVIAQQAESLGVDASRLATILRLTALPVLAHWAETWNDVRRGLAWEYGYCPICGSWPLLAESRGLEQLRFLRCGLCGSAWDGARFRCPFCANDDHRQLGYIHVEGEEARFRAATCDECRGYVKVVTTLSPLSVPQLLATDLATLHLDLIAAQRGFSAAPMATP